MFTGWFWRRTFTGRKICGKIGKETTTRNWQNTRSIRRSIKRTTRQVNIKNKTKPPCDNTWLVANVSRKSWYLLHLKPAFSKDLFPLMSRCVQNSIWNNQINIFCIYLQMEKLYHSRHIYLYYDLRILFDHLRRSIGTYDNRTYRIQLN